MSTTISGTNGVTFPDSTSMQTGQQAVKAWVNFNGTGTVAIRAGYNVSSVTDTATGIFTISFTTALQDANYSISGAIADNEGSGQAAIAINNASPPSASSLSIKTPNIGGSLTDSPYTCAAVFR